MDGCNKVETLLKLLKKSVCDDPFFNSVSNRLILGETQPYNSNKHIFMCFLLVHVGQDNRFSM